MKLLAVGLGGFLGALLRYGLSGLVHRRIETAFPLGTLAVNVLGCFAIGALAFLVEERQLLSPAARLFAMVGLLGGFTTFSTLGYETIELVRSGALRLALLSAAGNLVLGVAAVVAGGAAAALLVPGGTR